ncbi:hypothetical protein [Geoalkalibacter sp.]|uniref:hypothetical protein n=1 Tax=Geoalkalibacter sp. TaxID=3041440 RepID=UPI00272E5108|nr:hypothetical protein [Geoalkalibacter sp.]
MSQTPDKVFAEENFTVADLADEIRVDELCRSLLRRFYEHSTQEKGLSAEDGAALAWGADYFLRDFIIAERQDNLLRISPARIRQFGGTWYIIKNLEPNMGELSAHLRGIAAFYRFLADQGLISAHQAEELAEACADLAFYHERIESFWAITGDGYLSWERACSLKD